MQDYANERLRRHTPRPPQLQSFTMPEVQARSSSVHHASSVEFLRPLPDPQVEEAGFPQYDPHLFEIDEQSQLVNSYENVNCDSQSSTHYSAEGPPYMPRIDGAQGYIPQQSPFSQEIYLAELLQEDDVLQTRGHFGAVDSAFRQQGNYMGAASASNFRGNGYHIFSRESSTTLPLGSKRRRVGNASRDLQGMFRTGRRSSVERHSHLDIGNPAITQTPSVSRSFSSHTNTSGRQVDPLEQTAADGMDPPFVSPFDGGVLDWPSGHERIDLAGFPRSFSVDSGFPNDATSRAQNSHIGSSVSGLRRNSQSSYQTVARYHRGGAFQTQAQGARRATNLLSLAPDPSAISNGMQSVDNDGFARNPQELTKGAQADNHLAGNAETLLSPTWKPSRKAPSETHCDEGSDVCDNEGWQRPHIAPGNQHRLPTRGSKREHSSDSPSPTTTSKKMKRPKRKFTKEEKDRIKQKRKTGACSDCRRMKRKVCESIQTSLYHCQQAYCGCSARMSPLGLTLPLELSLFRANPLSTLHPAGLRNE